MKTLVYFPGMNSIAFNSLNRNKLLLPVKALLVHLFGGIVSRNLSRLYWLNLHDLKQMFQSTPSPVESELNLTNARGGHYGGGGGNIGTTVKAFIVGIILYFVAVAIVYTIGTSNIINNSQINAQIKNVAYFMAVLGTIIGLVAGTIFVLKLLGGL